MFRFLVLSALVACVFGNGLQPRFLSPTSRIIGGNDTLIENHPYQISIRGSDGKHGCGGSILSSRKVLTAAHCCDPSISLTIQYGITKVGSNENVISVAKVINHPDYNTNGNGNNDVCVLLLDKDIPFSNSSKPIELAKEEPSTGAKAVVTGWGYLNLGGQFATILQEADVDIICREECRKEYPEREVDNSMVCAGVKGYGKDCKGDSGGPLVIDHKLVGVVSWSRMCGQTGRPGVYANVAGLRDWIHAQ